MENYCTQVKWAGLIRGGRETEWEGDGERDSLLPWLHSPKQRQPHVPKSRIYCSVQSYLWEATMQWEAMLDLKKKIRMPVNIPHSPQFVQLFYDWHAGILYDSTAVSESKHKLRRRYHHWHEIFNQRGKERFQLWRWGPQSGDQQ